MCIGGEISTGTQRLYRIAKNSQMVRTRMHYGRGRLIEPRRNEIERGIHRQRIPEQSRASGQTEECKENIPGKAYGFRTAQRSFQPALRSSVQRGVLVDRVNEEVRVEKDHLRKESLRLSSSSSNASATESALSQRNACSGPSRNVF